MKIIFNNTTFNIPEAVLNAASTKIHAHLSSVMNGTGATINFGGAAYGIDSTKLSTAINAFVTHLGTIAGSGSKVKVGGVEYSIGSDKVAGAFGEFESELGRLESGGEELGFPITWNTMEVVNNASLPFDEIGAVKVSDYIPTIDEISNTIITMTDADKTEIHHKCSTIEDMGIFYRVTYQYASGNKVSYISIFVFPTSFEAEGIVAEAGLYATNFGSIEYNADCTLDLVEPPSDNGTNDSPYPIKYSLPTQPADAEFVKISDYIPSSEELNNLFAGITNYNYIYSLEDYQEIDGAFLANYNCRIDWNSNSSFELIGVSSLTPELQEMSGFQFTEPGLYITSIELIDATLILDIPDSSRYSSDINEYGFLYNYEYYRDTKYAEDVAVMIFREDGSVDLCLNGSVQPAAPAGTAIYSNNSIDLSSAGPGIGTVSSDGTRIVFETDSLIILPMSQKHPV